MGKRTRRELPLPPAPYPPGGHRQAFYVNGDRVCFYHEEEGEWKTGQILMENCSTVLYKVCQLAVATSYRATTASSFSCPTKMSARYRKAG